MKNKKVRIARIDITPQNVIDDDKFAVELYVCGCKHKCKGCHNPDLRDFNYKHGKLLSIEEICREIKKTSVICDIVLYLGGDFGDHLDDYMEISRYVKEDLGMMNVLYTGYQEGEIDQEKLKYSDVVLYNGYDPKDPDKKKQYLLMKRKEF